MSVSTYDTINVSADAYHELYAGIEVLDSRKFYSEGKSGKFELRTFITITKNDLLNGLPNLGFGVWDEENQTINDQFRVNNGDMQKILSTVATIALAFLKKSAFEYLYAEGSTLARTRLYQRELVKIYDDLPEDLKLYGLIKENDTGFADFKKGVNYDGFLLSTWNH